MAGDPAPPIAEPGTFRRQDRSISFGPRPLSGQDIIFAFCSPIDFSFLSPTDFPASRFYFHWLGGFRNL